MMSMLQEQWERMKSQYQSQEAQNQYVLHTIPPPGMLWKFLLIFESYDICLAMFALTSFLSRPKQKEKRPLPS